MLDSAVPEVHSPYLLTQPIGTTGTSRQATSSPLDYNECWWPGRDVDMGTTTTTTPTTTTTIRAWSCQGTEGLPVSTILDVQGEDIPGRGSHPRTTSDRLDHDSGDSGPVCASGMGR